MNTDMGGSGGLRTLANYWRAFAYYWSRRHQLPGMRLTIDEADFSPPAIALEERPVSPTARISAGLLMAFVGTAIVWSALGHVDIVAKATGKIVPGGRSKTIASVDTAAVRAIHVVDGQIVKAGDILIELDAGPFEADRDKAGGDERSARLRIARSLAMIKAIESGRAPRLGAVPGASPEEIREARAYLDGQYADYVGKLTQADMEVQHYSEALPLAVEREKIYASLLQEHDVSTDAWLEKKQARIDLEGHLTDAHSARSGLVAQARREALDALEEASKTAASSAQDVRHADSHARWLTLRATEDGVVQELTVHTLGGVVEAAQPLMQIVPIDKRVEVDATVENKDVGFIEVGQPASVKLAAFEYTKYGTLPGRVDFVSHDAIEAKDQGKDQAKDRELTYAVRVTLDRPTILVQGRLVHVSPGMSVDVDIKTGRRRIIEYLLSPLLRHQQESLHER